jgi:hypothetical protein
LGCFLFITQEAQFFGYFSLGKSYVLFLTKDGLGYTLGRFFSQTHPVTLAVRVHTEAHT